MRDFFTGMGVIPNTFVNRSVSKVVTWNGNDNIKIKKIRKEKKIQKQTKKQSAKYFWPSGKFPSKLQLARTPKRPCAVFCMNLCATKRRERKDIRQTEQCPWFGFCVDSDEFNAHVFLVAKEATEMIVPCPDLVSKLWSCCQKGLLVWWGS